MPQGRAGALQTLDLMAKLARDGSRSMRVRQLAVELTTHGFREGTGLAQKDFAGEAARLLEFVRDEIRYVRDIAHVETVHDADRILQLGAGDCDDKAILLAALLGSIGFEHVRFVAAAWAPDRFSHVWTQAFINGRWVDLEPTEPLPFGASVPTGGVVAWLTKDVFG